MIYFTCIPCPHREGIEGMHVLQKDYNEFKTYVICLFFNGAVVPTKWEINSYKIKIKIKNEIYVQQFSISHPTFCCQTSNY